MTAITNNYSAKSKFHFVCEIRKRTKRGKLEGHMRGLEVFRDKKFGNSMSAKRFVEKKYELALEFIKAKNGFEIHKEGSWEKDVFTIWLKKKNKGGDKTLNSNYELIFRLCKFEKGESRLVEYRRGFRRI